MKAKMIYLAMLMMSMFIMPACNNEEGVNIDGNEDFPECQKNLRTTLS
jgi:hypothetical protein